LADTLSRDPAELEEGDEPATADAEGLICFLEGEVLPWFEARKKELANRSLIREQAFGESRQAGAARPLRGRRLCRQLLGARVKSIATTDRTPVYSKFISIFCV
jgi:hypothetical protein